MNKLAEKVQQALVMAINNDDLVLPTLPEVALKIRQAAEDPEISISHLSKVIGRATQEVTDLHTAITRLGTNYSSNLAIGLVMEQIFHARSEAVDQKMRDVWRRSLEVAGVSYVLCRSHTQLKPDQAALGGLVHQIGVLPILTYAEDHYELLSDPVALNHVIDSIHPLLGDKLLRGWDFPEMLAELPGQYLNLERDSASLDYIDLVQIAMLYCHRDTDHPLADFAVSSLPALKKLRVDPYCDALRAELDEARSMFY
jgi:HD-like signal output (HDOD) protein